MEARIMVFVSRSMQFVTLSKYEDKKWRIERLRATARKIEDNALIKISHLHDHKGTLEVEVIETISFLEIKSICEAWESQGEYEVEFKFGGKK